ncbi:capsule assembly Wzi family protein [uncultured Hymenobacter sp.]|uniref:capsule assembly Wzi family protein n=1 Tax=uncultured Hymenobacter sp. TaxID=170016 RepID=UPI0035CA6E42
MKKYLLVLTFHALLIGQVTGQSMSVQFDGPVPPPQVPTADIPTAPNTVSLDADVYRLIDRYAIKYGGDSTGNNLHTSVRPYTRSAVVRLAERMLADSANLSVQDRFNAEYLLRDNWNHSNRADAANQSRRPVLKHFYQRQSDLYSLSIPDFTLRVNPVLGLSAGKDSETDGLRYVNTRGVQVEGTIDERLGFYTFLADNQQGVPFYVQQRIRRDSIVPHEGYWKSFRVEGGSQYDFFTARGYITYAATKHVSVQLGHDRNFIGNGYRSLILSDYSAPYFFLKLNTRIWKLNYQNLFTEMIAGRSYDENGSPIDTLYRKKYMALHHLSFDVTPTFNVGVFESTILGGRNFRRDSSGRNIPGSQRRGFELQYLNPLIFYRAVEQQVGSADNTVLGLDFKWNIKNTVQLYGQFMLDEFKLSEIRAGNGWWANKQALQLGAKYVDVAGIRTLDVQGEFNYIRPFTYQHEDSYTNYQHYQQPLAHPMGANLYELLGILSYQPIPRLQLVSKVFYTVQGLDRTYDDGSVINYGGNVLLPYDPRVQEYGNTISQGNRTRLLHTDLTATYQPRHNLWLDAKLIVRRQSFIDAATQNTVFPSVALRWNIAQRLHEF